MTVNRSPLTVHRLICPFCSFGCELGITLDDFGINGVEYLKGGVNDGRLCPRGSAAASYANHPKRLTSPIKGNQYTTWGKVQKEIKKILANPKEIAITFDRNLTIEEYNVIINFCHNCGIENIASTYFEPETFFNRFVEWDKPFSIAEIVQAQMIIVLGDLFNQSPMFSKTLINWKLQERKNRLVVIDSMTTHTSVFASDFLRVNPGAEPLLLFGLSRTELSGINLLEITNIADAVIKNISQTFKEVKNGLIIPVLPFGHTYDPLLLVESLAHLSEFSGKKVMPFYEFLGFAGKQSFGSVLELVKKKKVKYLINFGELFPFYYPQLKKELKGLTIYATSTLKYDGFAMLPAALNLEKEGTVRTTFGKKNLSGNLKPPSGAKTVAEIISLFEETSQKTENLPEMELKIDIKERFEKLSEKIETKKKKTFTLLGEKIAYNFLGFYEEEMLKINPADAKELGIKPKDIVTLESKHQQVNLPVKLTKDVSPGMVALPAETVETKGIFDFEVDQGIINFLPTEVRLWRKE